MTLPDRTIPPKLTQEEVSYLQKQQHFPKLNAENFFDWKQNMTLFLSTHHLEYYLFHKPNPCDEVQVHSDACAHLALRSAVEEDQYEWIRGATTTQEAMELLVKHH